MPERKAVISIGCHELYSVFAEGATSPEMSSFIHAQSQ
jgi:hypothetical protein